MMSVTLEQTRKFLCWILPGDHQSNQFTFQYRSHALSERRRHEPPQTRYHSHAWTSATWIHSIGRWIEDHHPEQSFCSFLISYCPFGFKEIVHVSSGNTFLGWIEFRKSLPHAQSLFQELIEEEIKRLYWVTILRTLRSYSLHAHIGR